MTATDVLRRMLDELGVEWWQKKRHTCWKVSKGDEVEMWRAWEAPDGSLTLKVDCIYGLTPEQAIAATLGATDAKPTQAESSETCHITDNGPWGYPYVCSACGASFDSDINGGEFNFCPNCGRRIVDEKGERMSITDELREWWVHKFPIMDKELHKDFTAIADRIDAEHQKAVASVMNDALYHANEKDMAELGWIRLPKDADGEYIHVGDALDGYGKTIEVVELRHGRSGWVLISRDGNGYADTFAFTHHAPAVEDVLREFVDAWAEWKDGAAMMNPVETFAARLRLREDA